MNTFLRIIGSLAVFLLFVFAPTGQAQGLFTFNNNTATKLTNGPGPYPGAGTAATGVTVAVYFSANTNFVTTQSRSGLAINLNAITNTLSGPLAGIFIGGTRSVPGAGEGATVAMQIRAWTGGFATYEEAFSAVGLTDIALGESTMFLVGPLGGSSTPTPSIFGAGKLDAIQVFPPVVPEPSTYPLGALGLAVFVLLRGRNAKR